MRSVQESAPGVVVPRLGTAESSRFLRETMRVDSGADATIQIDARSVGPRTINRKRNASPRITCVRDLRRLEIPSLRDRASAPAGLLDHLPLPPSAAKEQPPDDREARERDRDGGEDAARAEADGAAEAQ